MHQSLSQQQHHAFAQSVKQKLAVYEKLFEENVELKCMLKSDLQKIVQLKLELQAFKGDGENKSQLDSQIKLLLLN